MTTQPNRKTQQFSRTCPPPAILILVPTTFVECAADMLGIAAAAVDDPRVRAQLAITSCRMWGLIDPMGAGHQTVVDADTVVDGRRHMRAALEVLQGDGELGDDFVAEAEGWLQTADSILVALPFDAERAA